MLDVLLNVIGFGRVDQFHWLPVLVLAVEIAVILFVGQSVVESLARSSAANAALREALVDGEGLIGKCVEVVNGEASASQRWNRLLILSGELEQTLLDVHSRAAARGLHAPEELSVRVEDWKETVFAPGRDGPQVEPVSKLYLAEVEASSASLRSYIRRWRLDLAVG